MEHSVSDMQQAGDKALCKSVLTSVFVLALQLQAFLQARAGQAGGADGMNPRTLLSQLQQGLAGRTSSASIPDALQQQAAAQGLHPGQGGKPRTLTDVERLLLEKQLISPRSEQVTHHTSQLCSADIPKPAAIAASKSASCFSEFREGKLRVQRTRRVSLDCRELLCRGRSSSSSRRSTQATCPQGTPCSRSCKARPCGAWTPSCSCHSGLDPWSPPLPIHTLGQRPSSSTRTY